MALRRCINWPILIFLVCIIYFTNLATSELALDSCSYDSCRLSALKHQTKSMFYHAFDSYMNTAFPLDELRPLTCKGEDTFGGLSVSLVDTLDSLIIFEDWPYFVAGAKYLRNHLTFNVNTTVSVFETTIRVLGGLLSAHGFLTDSYLDTGFDPTFWYPNYDNALLYLAVDLADRLMPVFDTPTSIPYGAVHLQHGVMFDESIIASTAGAGSLIVEFGTLTRYTGDTKYYKAAFDALAALHSRAAWTGLVGNHINLISGHWVATESGVGGLVDSYYEYMLKGYILFGDTRLLRMFETSYRAIQAHVYKKPWYLDADMSSGQTVSLRHSSLSAFFPELQVLTGRLRPAIETTRAHYSAWRKYGCLPEGLNVATARPFSGQINYPLRPELVEAIWYLHWATNDPAWIGAAANVLHTLEVVTRVPCGYCEIKNARTLEKGDLMPSFMMSETLKYLYLVFASNQNGSPHWVRSGNFVFTTEAHPFRIMVDEFINLMPEVVEADEGKEKKPTRLPEHRRKCARHSAMQASLICGYGMAGTDFPDFDRNTLAPEPLSIDVELQVQAFFRAYGVGAVRVGGVFAGANSAYRVMKVESRQVYFSKLVGDERDQWLGRNRTCDRWSARLILRRICRPSNLMMM